MNFFEYQEQARRKTGLLVCYYGLAVVAIVWAIYFVFAMIRRYSQMEGKLPSFWMPDLFLVVALATLMVIVVGTVMKVVELAGGGSAVARLLGGTPVSSDTINGNERRLLNVVEEMSIAAGVPMPAVYILDREPGINAFAAGYTMNDAAVTVTRGCLEQLSRDELQGVVAHEFSHILNSDMRLNIRLMGVLHGILVVSLIGYAVMRLGSALLRGSSSRRSRNNPAGFALVLLLGGVAIWIIGSLGVFFSRLIKSAVSRQREFLADASAVQFTRNPDGLSSALKKIGGWAKGSRLATPRAEEASHFFFANGMASSLTDLMATHPALEARIARLDPAFNPDMAARGPESPLAAAAGAASGFVAGAGNVGASQIRLAQAIRGKIPEELIAAIRNKEGAMAVLYALLINENKDAAPLLDKVAAASGAACGLKAQSFLPLVRNMEGSVRFALMDIALYPLKRLLYDEYERFRETAMAIVSADSEMNLFEYAFSRMLVRHLDRSFNPPARPGRLIRDWDGVRQPAAVVIAALARVGHDDAAMAAEAYQQTASGLFSAAPPAMPGEAECALEAVDAALAELSDLAPSLKQAMVQACVQCVARDNKLTDAEVQLLRAVVDVFECPVPPLLAAA
jgi:Zn-dependent protease with chaperone function